MSNNLRELIQTVFDNLESLDEKEFRDNLASYYDDPLTEILSNTKGLIDTENGVRYIPPFAEHYYEGDGIFMQREVVEYYQTIFGTYIQPSGESLAYSNISTELMNQHIVDGYQAVTCDWILNGVAQITEAGEWDIEDQDYLWAEAA
ncbi:MAG: hypothetical protein JXB42_12705 [Deltaproteobacteria bacterium]|nr:hypothetical protein [Deltaproteobacteria bacterium]